MKAMTQGQMAQVAGGDFWSALFCGVGIAAIIMAPEIAVLQGATIAIACVRTFVD